MLIFIALIQMNMAFYHTLGLFGLTGICHNVARDGQAVRHLVDVKDSKQVV